MRFRQGIFMFITTLAGLGTAFVSWLLKDAEQWWSSTLANVAVAIFLLVPGEFLLAKMRTGFAKIEKATDEVRATAESAMESAQQTARSLEDVRGALMDRQHAEYQAELDVFRDIVNHLSRDSLLEALRKATDDELVSEQGVRAPIWETRLHYRYVMGAGDDSLEVRLEEDNGEVVSAHPWQPGVTSEEFFQRLVQAVRDAGEDLGVGLNDPTQSIEELSEMLVDVASLRAQELMGHRQTLKRLVERRDGWYFTETSLMPTRDPSYVIHYSRLDEMDWEKHLLGKGWHDAPEALQFARRLMSKPPQPAGKGKEAP